ncbi:MAG: hypothetical protein M3N53_03560 [Actinomycetota bacterium]|nr:hypothetical protein [Actinomycetota bacterium]
MKYQLISNHRRSKLRMLDRVATGSTPGQYLSATLALYAEQIKQGFRRQQAVPSDAFPRPNFGHVKQEWICLN